MVNGAREYLRPHRLTDDAKLHYYPAPTFKMFALDCDVDIDFSY